MPEVARRLPIPSDYDADGIRRYGFHGLSYEYLMQALAKRDPGRAGGKVVLAHLGNGSSVAAVAGGRCADTSMGFTPLAGVVMGTRSGDIDPGVVTVIGRRVGGDFDRVQHVLSHESGLLAISRRTADMRELLAHEASDPDCRLAVDVYCYEIRKRIGAYAAALGGLDAIVFSGGIGERAGAVRARICQALQFLGVAVEPARNAADAEVISTDAARVPVHVIRTDEEAILAQAGSALLKDVS
jgi:acetate kinase